MYCGENWKCGKCEIKPALTCNVSQSDGSTVKESEPSYLSHLHDHLRRCWFVHLDNSPGLEGIQQSWVQDVFLWFPCVVSAAERMTLTY